MRKAFLFWVVLFSATAILSNPVFATTYEVGPGKTYANIRDVPWESIAAGDTVNIYYKSTPYNDKFDITVGGTQSQPFTVHGVPDASGNLPVIDGNGAYTRTQMTYPSDERAVINVGRGSNHPDGFVTTYVTIENLEIKNGNSPNQYHDDTGAVKTFQSGANGFYVIMSEHVTIRNCAMHDNGEGFFFSSSDGYGTTKYMTVEGCYVYNNGVNGSDQVHGSYCESLGITYQYNHYGPLASGCSGANLKDRSANTVIRYNWFEQGFWHIDLIDPEDSTTIANDPSYGGAFVYGNVLVKSDGAPQYRLLHWGGDGSDTSRYRDGTLEFYNNTFVDRTTNLVRLFQGSTVCGQMNVYNNILYGGSGGMYITYRYGTTNISHNWITSGYGLYDEGGTANDDGTNLTGSDPGFVDYANQDYHLTSGSVCRDAGKALPSVDLPDNNVVRQYVKHQSSEARPSDSTLDIGAYEYSAGGSTYYVATNGNDNNDGSSGSPWATLKKAADNVVAGDTVIVRKGAYAGWHVYGNKGTSSAPITFRAENTGGVTLNAKPSNATQNAVVELQGNESSTTEYWIVDGFVIDGNNKSLMTLDCRWVNHCTFQNLTVYQSSSRGLYISHGNYNLTTNCVSHDNGEHGSYCANAGTYNVFRKNACYGNTAEGMQANGDLSQGGNGLALYYLYDKNAIYSNPDKGLNFDGCCNSTFKNNLLYNNVGGGIALFQIDAAKASSDDLIYNNTILASRWCIKMPPASETGGPGPDPVGNKVKNNVLYTTSFGSIYIYSPSMSGFESDYNVVVDRFSVTDEYGSISLATWRTYGYDVHSIISDPTALFVNAGSNDYHLKSGSPAMNAGTTLAEVTDDMDGNSRPQGGAYDIGCYEYAGAAPLAITTTSLPADTVNAAYSQTLAATGGTTPYTWSVASGSLPTGLSLASSTGVISGTPTAAGTSNFTARVTDNVSATDDQALSIVINAAVSVTTSSLPADTVGVAYSQALAATGGTGALTWSIQSGSLPAGLSLSSGGVISGTPTAAGTSNFTARATDTVGAYGTKALSIVINAAVTVTTSSLPADTVNIAYSQTLSATGGTGALAWSVQSGSLPAGLSLSSGGVISGTPTTAGTSNFTVRATDTVSAYGTKALSIVINAAPSITTSSLPAGTVNVAYSQTLAATGGTAPLTWSISAGSLPAGLSLTSSTGVISGTPTATGTSNFTAKVTDSLGAYGTKALSITVNAGGGAQTYYVATNGSDSYDGSSGAPWLTIQHAVDTINAGDTIIVRNGTYSGFRVRYSGASGSVKTVRAENALGAVINAAGAQCTTPSFIEIKNDTPANGVSYWVIDGFETTGSANYGIEMQYGDHVTAANCKVHNSAIAGITMQFSNYCTLQNNESYSATSGSGFYVGCSGDYGTLAGNSSHNNPSNGILIESDVAGGDQLEANWIVEKNTIYAQSVGLLCDGMETSTMRNNLAYGITNRPLYMRGYASAATSRNNRVLSNTFLATGTGSYAVFVHKVTAGLPEGVGNKLFDNVLYNYNTSSTTGSICVDTAAETSFESDYNVVMSYFGLDDNAQVLTLSQWRTRGYDVHSIQAADTALFVDPGGNDYHLKSDSPAKNAGTTLADVTDDKDGNSRPQGGACDIGCYEYVEGVADLVITTASLPDTTVGAAYNQALQATGGVTPYSWSVVGGSLPAGLSLGFSTGTISGTPTTAGTSNFTVRVTDSQGTPDTDDQALSIVVNAAPSITTSSLPADTINVAYSQTLAATGGTGALTWSLQSGSLPTGLSLNASTGAITGTPTAAGTSNFTAKATDTLGAYGTKALSIVINAAPSITTTSLPNGAVGTAYSQTLVSTGGTSPLSWSLQSGSLPAGLSLNASTGVISGTPTTAGTSNFTAKVTDNVGAYATQALSITIDAGGTSATYQFVASDGEASTTSTSYVNKTTMTFTPSASDDWIVFALAESKESSTSYRAGVRLTIDGAVAQESDAAPKDTTDYQSFSAMKVATLSAASHTMNIDYKTSNAGGTAYIRNARIVAVRKAALELYSNDGGDTGSDLTTTMTDYATASWTPPTGSDYLVMYGAEWNAATTSYSTTIEGIFNTQYTFLSTTVTSCNTGNWYTVVGHKTAWCDAGVQQTAKLRAMKQSGSGAVHHIRRARVAAFNLTSGRFSNFQMARQESESTTTSTSYQQKITKSISVGTAQDWLVICNWRLANTSTSYSSEAQVQLDNTTTLANPMRRPQATTDYFECSCFDVRNLATGTRVFDLDYRTKNSSGTAKIKYCMFVALPL